MAFLIVRAPRSLQLVHCVLHLPQLPQDHAPHMQELRHEHVAIAFKHLRRRLSSAAFDVGFEVRQFIMEVHDHVELGLQCLLLPKLEGHKR